MPLRKYLKYYPDWNYEDEKANVNMIKNVPEIYEDFKKILEKEIINNESIKMNDDFCYDNSIDSIDYKKKIFEKFDEIIKENSQMILKKILIVKH